jgi:hypothetical protein
MTGARFDPDYELIERVWVDVAHMGNQDSLYVELIDGKGQITLMKGQGAEALQFPPAEIKRLRNALTRLLARLPKEES